MTSIKPQYLSDMLGEEILPSEWRGIISKWWQRIVKRSDKVWWKFLSTFVDSTVWVVADTVDNIIARPISNLATEIWWITWKWQTAKNTAKFILWYVPMTVADILTATATSIVSVPAKMTIRWPIRFTRDLINSNIWPKNDNAKWFWKVVTTPYWTLAWSAWTLWLSLIAPQSLWLKVATWWITTSLWSPRGIMMTSAALAPLAELRASWLSSWVSRVKNLASNRDIKETPWYTQTAKYWKDITNNTSNTKEKK